jgi:hypothetical protein
MCGTELKLLNNDIGMEFVVEGLACVAGGISTGSEN